MEQTDLIQATSVNTEINALTDKLEQPTNQEVRAPIRSVETFWERLDSLLGNLEENASSKKKERFHSFLNQPERVNISSDSDLSTVQAQFGIQEESFNSFRVAIIRPFLDVKSIQLLRASIPNAVTNIPDNECTFWYYRLPFCYSGTISLSIVGVSGYSNATFSTTGVITPAVSTATLVSITPSFPSVGVATYFITSLTGLANGSSVTISGVTPAGYNGTFIISDISIVNVSFRVVNATTGAANVASATLRQNITDTIDFNLGTINAASGAFLGFYNVTDAAFGTNTATIFNYSGSSIGTIVATNASKIIQQPSTSNLYMNRLLPSYYKEELFDYSTYKQAQNPYTTYGLNRTFGDYQSVLTELKKCSLRDPAYDTNGGVDLSGAILMRNFFIPGDITFSFNEQINRFRMNGNNALVTATSPALNIGARRYLIAGFNDPNIATKAEQLRVLSAGISGGRRSLDFPGVVGATMDGMPYILYKTLNLRLGFVWDGAFKSVIAVVDNTVNGIQRSLLNRLRPIMFDTIAPPDPPPAPELLGVTRPQFTTVYTADTYADLVYTNTVSLYADFVGGSTYDSITNTQLLACVPMNASNLGVTFYNSSLYCPLTKISDQIYEIEIRMLTDTGAPYTVPNSAIVSLELALTY
jgi:hypothetical protein